MSKLADELFWLVAILLIGGIAIMSSSGLIQIGCVFAIVVTMALRTTLK